MKIKITFIGWLLFCLAGCMADRDATLRLQQAGELLEEYPDSALRLLQAIPEPEEMPARQRARYALLMTAATDKCELPLLPCDSLLHFALGYYSDRDLGQAVAQLYQGRLWDEMNDSKQAIECTLKAWDILQDYPDEQLKYGRLIFSALGLWYGDSGLYDKALEAEHLALRYATSPQDSALAFDHIGSVYVMRELKDSAISYKRKSLEYAFKDSSGKCVVGFMHNLSLCYSSFEDIDSAFYYAREVLKCNPVDDKDQSLYYSNIGNLFAEHEKYDSARYYLEKSLYSGENHQNSIRASTYTSLAYVEEQLGNYENAYRYMDAYMMLNDSLAEMNQVTKIQHVAYKYDTEMKLKNERVKGWQKLVALLFVSTICIFCIILFYQRKINRKKREQQIYQNSLGFMKKELEQMQLRIDDNLVIIHKMRNKESIYTEEIEKREQLIKQLEEDKLKLRGWLFSQAPIYKKVMALASQKSSDKRSLSVLSSSDLNKLHETVFQIYEEYVQELRIQYPKLTDVDILVLCLQKLNLSSLTISLCLGHSDTVAYNKRKSRIKERMSQE